MSEVEATDPKAYDFLRAIIITSEAVIRLAHRFADEAARLAPTENDPTRPAAPTAMGANPRPPPPSPPPPPSLPLPPRPGPPPLP